MEIYVCLMKVYDTENDKYDYYVLCERDGQVFGFETLKKGIDHFDRGYESAFKRGLGAINGATLAHTRMNPSIVEFETQAKMIETLFDNPPYTFGNIHSWNYGILCQKDVSEYWENGEKPELFKEIE